MLKLNVQGYLAVLSTVLIAQPLFAVSSCASWSGYTAPTLPTPTAILTTSNPGTGFAYYADNGYSANEFSYPAYYTYLPSEYYSLSINGTGGFYNGHGAFSNPSTWPSGSGTEPWALNSSATISTIGSGYNTSCQPGVNCDACEASASGVGSYDCTGQPVARTPALGVNSPAYSGIVGFDWTGYFAGEATQAAQGAIGGSAYFHESPVFLGGYEFGFYSTWPGTTSPAAPAVVYFYWSQNTNCTDPWSNSICNSSSEGGSPAGTGNLTPTGAVCSVSSSPGTSQTYTAYLVKPSGSPDWVFYVTVGSTAYIVDRVRRISRIHRLLAK